MSDAQTLKVSISYKPLFELLSALRSRGPEMREIQALSGSSIEELKGKKTCLSIVLDEFNAEVQRHNSRDSQEAAPKQDETTEQQAAPTDEQPVSNECIVPFVFDAVNDQGDQLQQYKGGLWEEICLTFNTNVDLRSVVAEYLDKSIVHCDVSHDGYFDDLLEVTGILVYASTSGEDIPIKLAIPKGKRVGMLNDEEGTAFNVTIEHKGRLFTLESFFGFDPKTGTLRAVAAGIQTDVSLERLATSLGIDDLIKSIRPAGYYIRGIYHGDRTAQI